MGGIGIGFRHERPRMTPELEKEWAEVRAILKAARVELQQEAHGAAAKVRKSNCFTRKRARQEFERILQERKDLFEGERWWAREWGF